MGTSTLRKSALLLLLPPLLGACALFPLSEGDCKGVNWREKGYAHGYGGSYRQDMRYVPECRERFGVEVDQVKYLEGWRDGHNEWDRLIGSRMQTR